MSCSEQIVLDIKRSKQLIGLMFFAHGAVVYSLLIMPLSVLLTSMSMLLIGLSLAYYVSNLHQVTRLVSLSDNDWHMKINNGDSFVARFTGEAYSNSWLTLLVFNSVEKKLPTYILLLKDSVTKSALSQLKIHLKIHSSNQEL